MQSTPQHPPHVTALYKVRLPRHFVCIGKAQNNLFGGAEKVERGKKRQGTLLFIQSVYIYHLVGRSSHNRSLSGFHVTLNHVGGGF